LAAARQVEKAEAEKTKAEAGKTKAEAEAAKTKADAEVGKQAAVKAALEGAAMARTEKAAAEAKAAEEAKEAAALSKVCDIMISYTQHNKNAKLIALGIYSNLKEKGYKVWLDVKVDDKSEAAMETAVTESKFIIAILSDGDGKQGNAYFERPFCLKELRWAKKAGIFIQPVIAQEDKKRINAFLYGGTYNDGTRFEGPPEDLRDLGSVDMVDIDVSDPEYFELGLKKIIRKARANGVEIDDHLNTPESPLEIKTG
jgi:hypothetical protein